MAAVYLQRLWKTRLGFYWDTSQLLPDLYSEDLGLPLADERFGKTGLYELAEAWKARSRYSFNRLGFSKKIIVQDFRQNEQNSPNYSVNSVNSVKDLDNLNFGRPLSAIDSTIDLFLEQLKLEYNQKQHAPVG